MKGKRKNAAQKVQELLPCRAPIFWAVGPDKYHRAFQLNYSGKNQVDFKELPKAQVGSTPELQCPSEFRDKARSELAKRRALPYPGG
jgi:hypothetical protein